MKRRSTSVRAHREPPVLDESVRIERTRSRMWGTAVVLGIFFCIALGQAFRVQVLEQEEMLHEAKKNYLREMVVESRRGNIVDRTGEQLATSIRVDTIVANPNNVKTPRETARALAEVLSGVDANVLSRKLESKSWWEYVKRRVSEDESRAVKALKLPGIQITQEWKRFYPKRELAGQVIGRVGYDAEGLEGLEKAFDDVLMESDLESSEGGSQEVRLSYVKDVRGRAAYVDGLPVDLAPEGHTIQLTLDEKIQNFMEGALERGVQLHKGRSGVAVMMDVPTGEVLGMAHYPPFNPNQAGNYDMYLWKNRAVKEHFEPGSSFKIFSFAAVLEHGAATLDENIDTENGRWRVADHWIHDTHRDESLSVRDVLGQSSNIGTAKLTRRIGTRKVYEIMKDFGFGDPTGIDMDAETRGSLRDPRTWDPVTFANISFGQGVAVSPIQLVAATAAIGNEGKLMRPRLVSRVHTRDGRVLQETQPELVRQVVRADTAEKVIDAMAACVEPGGTGTAAAIPGYTVAGKTGTAQKPATGYDRGRRVAQESKGGYLEDAWIASFVGLVPAEKPRLALLVVVDEPEGHAFGGVVAAPIFREIGEWTLKYLGVPPSNVRPIKVSSVARARDSGRRASAAAVVSKGAAKPISRMTADKVVNGIVPNFLGQGVVQVAAFARAARIQLEVEGSGRAVYQSVRPGTPVDAGAHVMVRLEPVADRHSSSRRIGHMKGAQL